MKKFSLLFLIFILTFININYSNSEEKVSSLHNKISQNLLDLKKEHPKTQTKVYSLLDQVCKLYQISKTTIKKKNELKLKVENTNKSYYLIKNENKNLKNEVNILKNKLNSKIKI
ncbi:hypothetical protein GF385_04935, partial [Candidatus Dependentiae bacterium]|nr:hypothetical protein [Candidatus Dependentiae bacterium]